MSNPTINDSIIYMMECHHEQLDKGGAPYWNHPYRVYKRVLPTKNVIAQHVALLHDVIEDTDATYKDLREHGYSGEVITGIEFVTQNEIWRGKPYSDWIRMIAREGTIASLLAKWADMADNSDEARIHYLPHHTACRLREKYKKAKEVFIQEVSMRDDAVEVLALLDLVIVDHIDISKVDIWHTK